MEHPEGKTPLGRIRKEDNVNTHFMKYDVRIWTGFI
jgi:hypothetical protein